MFRSFYFYLLLFVFGVSNVCAEEDYARFKQININDGLSLSSVYCIYQDSKGFMWFGTEDGLNRYDGQHIQVYGAQTEQRHLLANKWIEDIYEDKSGMIWLGSRGGLTMFNPRKGQFSILKHDPSDPSSLSNDTVCAIISDLRNEVWVGTQRGLNRVDRYTGEIERIVPDENDLLGLMSKTHAFLVDRSGILWIATANGLFSHDRKSGLFFKEDAGGLLESNMPVCCLELGEQRLWLGSQGALVSLDLSGQEQHLSIELSAGRLVEDLLIDRQNQLWIQTDQALLMLPPNGQELQKVLDSRGSTNSLALKNVKPLVEDQEGQIWFGTFEDGVYQIDPSSLDMKHYLHNPADPGSLAENSINCIFEDRSGTMWFGTFGAGISILDPLANQFGLLKHNPFNPNSLSSSFIWTIMEDRDGHLWMGTNTAGISVMDPRTETYTHYQHDPSKPFSLGHNSVRKIYQDSQGRVWIGTDGGGLNLFLPQRKAFRHFRHDPLDPSSISHNSVRAIYEDPQGSLWVGTRAGLNLMDPESGKFKRFLHDEHDDQSIPNNFIYSAMHFDQEGYLWVGTYGGGLCRMDPETGQSETFAHDAENPTSISDNIIFSIYEDPMGRFWIGTNSGLNMFYPGTGVFRRFGINEGMANEVIYGILPDQENHIWMSSNLGLIRFDLESFEVKNFDMNDGLQSNEFNGGAYFRGSNGRLYFGGVYGLNLVDPDELTPHRKVSPVTLSKLEVLGKEVLIAGADIEEAFEEEPRSVVSHEGEFYTSENFTYMEELVLDYKQRFFSIEFAAMNHSRAGKLNYTYIMEGLDSDWVQAGDRNYVSYSNMKPGSYTFRVLAQNSDGFQSQQSANLMITITPPFWLSWWFILLEILFATAVAIMIYNYLVKSRTNRLLTYQNQQIREANEALRKSEKNLMELNATKDKFFSIISHDLKNPFSSILSISELMVENFDATDREDHQAGFRKINQSLKHLLDLLENLLTWSRSQRGKIKYEPMRFNLTKLIVENINIHKLPAERKGVILEAPATDEVYAYGDRDMINAVVRNLMTNAVKFTDKDQKVEVVLERKDEEIKVSICDEGMGIDEDDLQRLFKIDQKFKSMGTAGEKGTGLGLIICQEFVEKHGGSIWVDSTKGQGSTFSFTVPMAN